MTTVEVEDRIAAPLEKVWALVSDFTGFVASQGLTFTSEGEGIGMTRTIELFGSTITERWEELDEDNHTTSYSIVQSPLPLGGYQAWIALTDEGPGATGIRWWSKFEPVGADEESTVEMVRGVYTAGIEGIKKVTEG